VLHANQAARHELARRQVISVQEGHLHTPDATQARVLQQALAKAETGRRSLIALRSPTRSRLSIAVVPLRSERHHGNPPVALVFSLFVGSIIATQLHQYFAPATPPISSFGALIALSLPEVLGPVAIATVLGAVGGVVGERLMPTR